MNTSRKLIQVTSDQAHVAAIETFLKDIQGKAHADILRAQDIVATASKAEEMLRDAQLPKSQRLGAVYVGTPGGPACTSYGYTRLGTAVTLVRAKNEWRLVKAERVQTWPGQNSREEIILKTAQKHYLLRKLINRFNVTIDELQVFLKPASKLA